jgi:hypothetical protein
MINLSSAGSSADSSLSETIHLKGVDAVLKARVLHEQGRPSAPHPGSCTEANALLFARDGQVDDIWVIADYRQELLQVDARDGCGEVYPGALQAAIDGKAGGHHC